MSVIEFIYTDVFERSVVFKLHNSYLFHLFENMHKEPANNK
jgi:hypothetical protein